MRRLLCFLLLPWLHGVAFAASAPPGADACTQCHGAADRRSSVPQLEGQHAAYLRMELTHFRERHRTAFPMDMIAHDLSDAEIAALAEWFATRPWAAYRFVADPIQVAAGAQAAERLQCATCHGQAFAGTEVIPRTAGQNPSYLARQLRAFSRGERYHPPSGTGAPLLRLTDAEAQALAQYLAQLPPPSP